MSVEGLSPVKEFFELVFPFLERLPFIRAMFGIILVFFLPGFAWSALFFKKLEMIERIIVSLALSVVVVTLSLIFFSRVSGARINGFNSILIILMITILPVIAYYLGKFIKRGEEDADNPSP